MTTNILPHLISICKSHTNRNPQLNFVEINNLSVKFYGIAKAQQKIYLKKNHKDRRSKLFEYFQNLSYDPRSNNFCRDMSKLQEHLAIAF